MREDVLTVDIPENITDEKEIKDICQEEFDDWMWNTIDAGWRIIE